MGNDNPESMHPSNMKERIAIQSEIAATIKNINNLQDKQVAKDTEVAEIIKKAKRPQGKGETFYHRKQRVDSLFNATVSSSDIVEFVQTLVTKAKAGDLDAIRIILDRLAGKAPAFVDVTSGGETLNTHIDLVLDVSKGPGMILEGDATRVESLSSPSGADATEPSSDGAVEAPGSTKLP